MSVASALWAPAAPEAHWDSARLLAVDVCNAIPDARWALYGNLADTYNDLARIRGIGSTGHTGHTFGLYVDDHHLHGSLGPAAWTVPWHRMRDNDGLCRAYGRGRVYDPEEHGNVVWRAEGGRLARAFGGQGLSGSAVPHQQIDLRSAVRRGDILVGGAS